MSSAHPSMTLDKEMNQPSSSSSSHRFQDPHDSPVKDEDSGENVTTPNESKATLENEQFRHPNKIGRAHV